MEYRNLGRSGLRVSVLTMGTMTFGGGEHFDKAGNTDLAERAGGRSTSASTPGST